MLVTKARRAAQEYGAKGLCLAGGVAANSPAARARSSTPAWPTACTPFLPSRSMCTDNAAMVAAAGWWRLQPRRPVARSTPAPTPNLQLPVV